MKVSVENRQARGNWSLDEYSPSRTRIASTSSSRSAAQRANTLLMPGSSPMPWMAVRPAFFQAASWASSSPSPLDRSSRWLPAARAAFMMASL